MVYLAVFLVTFVLVARALERKNMKIAAAFHAVLFIIILLGMLFTSELGVIRLGMENIFGRDTCLAVKEILIDAAGITITGVRIAALVWIVTALQGVLSLLFAVRAAVKYFAKKGFAEQIKKAPKRHIAIHLYHAKRRSEINLLYCRALN